MAGKWKDILNALKLPFKDHIAEFGRHKKAERVLTFTPPKQTNAFATFYTQFQLEYKGSEGTFMASNADQVNEQLTKLNPKNEPIARLLNGLSLRFKDKEKEIETHALHSKAFWRVGAPIGGIVGWFANSRLLHKFGKKGLFVTTALAYGIAHLVAYCTRGCFNVNDDIQRSGSEAISAATGVQNTATAAIQKAQSTEELAQIYKAQFAGSVDLALQLLKLDSNVQRFGQEKEKEAMRYA